MNKIPTFILPFLCLILTGTALNAQLLIEASLENIVRDNNKVSFEIFLKTQGGSTENLYLDGSDFIITFDASNFSSPILQHASTSFGGNKFEPMSTDATDISGTRNAYYTSSSLAIAGNSLIINLNNQSPANTTDFTNSIAQIDNQASVHSLGLFEITGIIDPTVEVNLAWDADNIGLRTVITSLESTAPFASEVIPTGDIIFSVEDELLPTELISFSTDCDEENAVLTWTTASEINAAYTLIQKSGRDQNWITLETVLAEGSSFNTKNYSFTDKSEKTNERTYYRLVFVDQDGKTDYSPIQISNCDSEADLKMMAFPNPVSNGGMLNINIQGDKASTLHITDISGKGVFQSILNENEVTNQVEIPSGLSEGVYVVTMTTVGGKILNEKLFIQ